MWKLYVTLYVEERHRVLCKGHRKRCLWYAGTVAQLRYEEVIAREQRLLKRRRRYHIVLEEEKIDKVNGYKGEDNGIYPPHYELHGTV